MPARPTGRMPVAKRPAPKRRRADGLLGEVDTEPHSGPDRTRQEAVLKAAGERGLLKGRTGRISGRVSPALISMAKRATGLEKLSALIEFALASVTLDDHFGEALVRARGTVDPDLELGP